MFCPNCGSKNDDHAKFCEVCGTSLAIDTAIAQPRICPNCGMQIDDAGAGFCPNCATDLSSGTPTKIEQFYQPAGSKKTQTTAQKSSAGTGSGSARRTEEPGGRHGANQSRGGGAGRSEAAAHTGNKNQTGNAGNTGNTRATGNNASFGAFGAGGAAGNTGNTGNFGNPQGMHGSGNQNPYGYQPPVTGNTGSDSTKQKRADKGLNVAIVLVAVLIVALLGGGGYWFFVLRDKGSEDTTTASASATSTTAASVSAESAADGGTSDDTQDTTTEAKPTAAPRTEASSTSGTDATGSTPRPTATATPEPTPEPEHRYEILLADCTWEQAYTDCINRGGYLVRIETSEEFDKITQQIVNEGKSDDKFFVGGRREGDGTTYCWVNTQNQLMGDAINNSSYPVYSRWMGGEPSFRDGSTEENVMDLYYYKGESRWVLNDVPNNILAVMPTYSGRMGYICEYEN